MIAPMRWIVPALMVATVLDAQQAAQPELRRIVTGFRQAQPAAILGALAQVPLSSLSQKDRAIAEMYRGFALHRLRRSAESELALQRAAGIDASVLPDAGNVGQDLVDVYRVARARIPVIASFSVEPLEFIPQIDSTTHIQFAFEGGRILRRGRAQVRLVVSRKDSGDSVTVWSGLEGDSAASWNGMINGRLIEPGEYDYTLLARGPDIPVVSAMARHVRIEHLRVDSSRFLPTPAVPRVLPESSVFRVEDRERKSAIARRGMLLGIAGAAMAGTAAALVQTAVDRSAPRSGMRYAVAGTYVTGLAAVAVGAAVILRSRSARYRSEVAFPNNENIRLNRQLREEYTAALERVNKYNETLGRAIVVRQVMLDGGNR